MADTRRNTAVTASSGRGVRHNVAGIMLTMVDFDKYSKHRYGESDTIIGGIEGYYAA